MKGQQTTSEHFQFLESTHSKHLNCKLCSSLMLEPIRLHKCGHTFCKNCTEQKSMKKCPLCLNKIITKQKDILASRLVGELGVKCLHEGCPWQGTLSQFRSFHQSGCKLRGGGMEEWLKKVEESISFSRTITGNLEKQQQKDQKAIEKVQEHPRQYQNQQTGKIVVFPTISEQQKPDFSLNSLQNDDMNSKIQKRSTKSSLGSSTRNNLLSSTEKKAKNHFCQARFMTKNFKHNCEEPVQQ